MSNTEIVIKLVAEHFDILKDTVKLESDVFDDLGADSPDPNRISIRTRKELRYRSNRRRNR